MKEQTDFESIWNPKRRASAVPAPLPGLQELGLKLLVALHRPDLEGATDGRVFQSIPSDSSKGENNGTWTFRTRGSPGWRSRLVGWGFQPGDPDRKVPV